MICKKSLEQFRPFPTLASNSMGSVHRETLLVVSLWSLPKFFPLQITGQYIQARKQILHSPCNACTTKNRVEFAYTHKYTRNGFKETKTSNVWAHMRVRVCTRTHTHTHTQSHPHTVYFVHSLCTLFTCSTEQSGTITNQDNNMHAQSTALHALRCFFYPFKLVTGNPIWGHLFLFNISFGPHSHTEMS